MHNKLSRDELRIIEQTKKEGEELYADKSEQAEGSPAPAGGRKRAMAYVWLALIFLLLALATKLIFSWLTASVQ